MLVTALRAAATAALSPTSAFTLSAFSFRKVCTFTTYSLATSGLFLTISAILALMPSSVACSLEASLASRSAVRASMVSWAAPCAIESTIATESTAAVSASACWVLLPHDVNPMAATAITAKRIFFIVSLSPLIINKTCLVVVRKPSAKVRYFSLRYTFLFNFLTLIPPGSGRCLECRYGFWHPLSVT